MFRAAVAMTVFVAGDAHSAESQWPVVIPAPNGAVILASAAEKDGYDEFRYAAARRVDNMLYISGVVIGRRENEGTTWRLSRHRSGAVSSGSRRA